MSFGFYNVPGRMPLHANFTSHEIKFENDIRNCEDVVLLRDRPVALLVCDPGRETWNTVMVRMKHSKECSLLIVCWRLMNPKG